MTVILTCMYGSLEWLLPDSTVGLTGRYGVIIRTSVYEHVKKASRFRRYGAVFTQHMKPRILPW